MDPGLKGSNQNLVKMEHIYAYVNGNCTMSLKLRTLSIEMFQTPFHSQGKLDTPMLVNPQVNLAPILRILEDLNSILKISYLVSSIE